MKITVDVDCSPEEARRFLGLPDLSAVHEAYLAKVRQAIEEGPSAELMADMVKSWAPMGDASMGMWKQMFEQVSGKR